MKDTVFNFVMSSIEVSLLKDKLDYIVKELKCAAKVNLAFGVVLKTLGMECVDTFTLTRTILLWKELNLCLHKSI